MRRRARVPLSSLVGAVPGGGRLVDVRVAVFRRRPPRPVEADRLSQGLESRSKTRISAAAAR